MPRRPPFDILRWSFVLLAALMLVEVIETLIAVGGCAYMILSGRAQVGVCIESGIVAQVREIFSEALTAILALLLASRRPPDP